MMFFMSDKPTTPDSSPLEACESQMDREIGELVAAYLKTDGTQKGESKGHLLTRLHHLTKQRARSLRAPSRKRSRKMALGASR